MSALSVCWRDMENIRIYEINAAYINYLVAYAPHLFHNRPQGQANERKYIGSFYRSMVLTHTNSAQKAWYFASPPYDFNIF